MRAGRKKTGRGSLALVVVALGLAAVVAVVAFQRGIPGLSPAKSVSNRPPIIVKPGNNWLSPRDVTVVDGDTIRVQGRFIRLAGFDARETGTRARCPRERELAAQAST